MTDITSLESCFGISRVENYITSLDEIIARLKKIVYIADEGAFGKNVFYLEGAGKNYTVHKEVKKANRETETLIKEIEKLKSTIYKNAYKQRVADLEKYVSFCMEEVNDLKSGIDTGDTNAVNISINKSQLTNAITRLQEAQKKLAAARNLLGQYN